MSGQMSRQATKLKHHNESNHFDNRERRNSFHFGIYRRAIHLSSQQQKQPSAIQRHCRQAFFRVVLPHRVRFIKMDERRPVSRQESYKKAKRVTVFVISHLASRSYVIKTLTRNVAKRLSFEIETLDF